MDEIVELALEIGTTPSFPMPATLATRIATSESFGIIPIPTSKCSIRTIDVPIVQGVPHFCNTPVHLLQHLSTAPVSPYDFLRYRQRTAQAVVPIHSQAEYSMYTKLLSDPALYQKFHAIPRKSPAPGQTSKTINFEALATHWNQLVNEAIDAGNTVPTGRIYYKIPEQLGQHHKVWAAYRHEKATLFNSEALRKPATEFLADPARRAQVLPALPIPEPERAVTASRTSISLKGKSQASTTTHTGISPLFLCFSYILMSC